MSMPDAVSDSAEVRISVDRPTTSELPRVSGVSRPSTEIREIPVVAPIERPKNAEAAANPFSRAIFEFATNMLWRGSKKKFTDADLWDLAEGDSAEPCYEKFTAVWAEESKKEKPSVGKALIKTFWVNQVVGLCFTVWFIFLIFILTIYQGIAIAATLVQPTLLGYLITYLRIGIFDGGRDGYLYAMGFALLNMCRSLAQYNGLMCSMRTGVRMRATVMSIVYKKALRVSSVSRSEMDTGKIVSLISNDSQRIFEIFLFVNDGIFALPQLAVILALLYQRIYAYTFAGFAVLLVILPINGVALSVLQKKRAEMVGKTDFRTRLINEALQAIKVVKFYAWERSFEKTITAAREDEVSSLLSMTNALAVVIGLFPSTSTLVAMVAFLTLSINNPLDPTTVFTSLSYFNQLRIPLIVLPILLSSLAQFGVSMDRLRGFLTLPELPQTDEDENDAPIVLSDEQQVVAAESQQSNETDSTLTAGLNHQPKSSVPQIVRVTNGSFKWGAEEADPTSLTNVNFSVGKGELVMVIGSVGSGKSTFVNAVLGEITQSAGTRHLNGRVGYVPQQAWIVNDTVRNNIIFGKPFDADKYQHVLDVCALHNDLQILSGGDTTEIGERGVNLSGGQKQRISMARAVYANTDIVILDDPLSAVDAHVGRHMFYECVRGALKDRAVIMVTNQLQYLPNADHILVLKNGSVVESGTYDQLMEQKMEFRALVDSYAQSDEKEESDTEEVAAEKKKTAKKKKETEAKSSKKGDADAVGAKLTQDEEASSGLVGFRVFLNYFKSPGSYTIFAILICIYLIDYGTRGVTEWWLADWTANPAGNVTQYLYVYMGLSLFSSVMALISAFVFNQFTVRSAKALHKKLLHKVFRFPQSFFDVTPLGRVLNRFTKDIDNVDMLLPNALGQFMGMIFTVLYLVVVIAVMVPYILIVVAPLAIFFVLLTRFYRHTAIELQRLEALARGPVLSHFGASVNGRSSIRAYKATKRFSNRHFDNVNRNNRALLSIQIANQWLGVRLDLLGTILLFLVVVLVVAGNSSFITNPAFAALSVTEALTLIMILNRVSSIYADLEQKLNAPERLAEYNDLPEEAEPIIEGQRPPDNWPATGRVSFQNVWMQYRPDLPYVISDLSFDIKDGEKVGVVGRTGAGKSSVMLNLFRIVEASKGSVRVDGVDISPMGLEDLRSRLAIIPQEPFLFTGTIRSNLDPFNERTDEELWSALHHSQMEEVVKKDENGLMMPVLENGDNFSVGQRQLICLGRALLRKPKILLMDEATASVDVETDAVIQKAVRSEFKDSTVITIAHRLNTIIDYDRVMVLDKGQLAEFASPHELLIKDNGVFRGLVEDTGPESAAHLKDMAYKASQGIAVSIDELEAEV